MRKNKTYSKQTNDEFAKIFRPIEQLYTSYKGVVTNSTNSFAKDIGLCFKDVDWVDESLDQLNDGVITKMMFPKLGRYMDEDGELSDVFPDMVLGHKAASGLFPGMNTGIC